MTQASALRSFATTAEFVAGLMPKLALAKAMTRSEATHLAEQLRKGAEAALDMAVAAEAKPDGDKITLLPCQSLALRRLIDLLKADDSVYSACPEPVRNAIADIYMPVYSSAETQIADLEKAVEGNLSLLEKFARRIHDLEAKRVHFSGEATK